MDLDDTHLKTGRYDPHTYWSARARASNGNIHQAVCAFRLSDDLNLAMERVQSHFLRRMFSRLDLVNMNVLEIGCGAARWCELIESAGARYTGVDISSEMIELAKANRPGGTFEQISGADLPFADDAFDLVFSVTVLHHNTFEQQEELMGEAARVTRPDGHVLLMEDIVHDQSARMSFNMFPRTFDDWVRAATTGSRLHFHSAEFARWWLTADHAERMVQRLSRPAGRPIETESVRHPAQRGRFSSWIVRMANAFDILIQRLLPRRLAVNAAMLFTKPQAHSNPDSV